MSRLILTAVGDVDENVHLEETPDLTPGPDEVVVALEAATINPTDFLLAQGWYGIKPEIPGGLGTEGVGRVIEAGSAAHPGLVGRRVIILPTYEQWTWADRVVAPVRSLVTVGEGGDAAQLAMLAVNPSTAYILLNRYVSLQPGDWIGQDLGNSALGQYVVALAKLAGVKTLSVVRREDAAEQLRAQGADLVIVDGENLGDRISAALGENKLKLVLDGQGGGVPAEIARSLEFGGTVVSYSSTTGEAPVLPLQELIYREIQVHGFWVVNWVRDAPREEIERTYGELAALVEKGEISAAVEATYPLDRFREAFAHARKPGRAGKVIFTF